MICIHFSFYILLMEHKILLKMLTISTHFKTHSAETKKVYNDKKVSPSRRYNNYKHIHT